MEAPWGIYAASLSQLFPVMVALVFRERLSVPRNWIVLWAIVMALGDAAQYGVARTQGNNLWVNYIAIPIEDVLVLWTLSFWQSHPVLKLALRAAIPVFVLVWIAMVIGIEDVDSFSYLTMPFAALVMLGASIYTLVSNTLVEEGKVTERDWFWITLGLSLYFALFTSIWPFSRAYIAERPDLVRLAWTTRAWGDVLALILIARGMACPHPQAQSGGFFSLRPSR